MKKQELKLIKPDENSITRFEPYYIITPKELDELIKEELKKQLTLTDVGIALADEEYEPYFGWCDVDGCKNEGCSGGSAWRDTGYWTVCYKHSDEHRKGLEQPKMKQSSVERENKRDKKTGYLRQ